MYKTSCFVWGPNAGLDTREKPQSHPLTDSAVGLCLSICVNFKEYKYKKSHFRNDKMTNCIKETLKKIL